MSNIIGGAIYYCCLIFFTCCLMKFDFSNRRSLLASLFFFFLGFIIVMVLCTIIGIDAVLQALPFVILLPQYLAFRFIAVHKGLKLVFVLLTSSVLMFLPALLAITISEIIPNETLMSIIALLCITAVIVVLIKFMRPQFLFILQYVNSNGYWIAVSFIPILYNLGVYLLGIYNNKPSNETPLFFQVIIMALTLSAYVLIMLTFAQIKKNAQIEYDHNLAHMQIKTALENVERMKDLQMQTAIHRHDLRHHIQLINSYLNCKAYEKIGAYLKELTMELDDATLIHYCQNPTINLILSLYGKKSEEQGVDFTVTADIPEKINIDEKDLCVVLSNALENALNAAGKINEDRGKRITVECKKKDGKLVLSVENTYSGQVKFQKGLPKTNSQGHGLGTHSIVRIAEKYDGLFSFETEDSIFYFRLII